MNEVLNIDKPDENNPIYFDGKQYIWRLNSNIKGIIIIRNNGRGIKHFLYSNDDEIGCNTAVYTTSSTELWYRSFYDECFGTRLVYNSTDSICISLYDTPYSKKIENNNQCVVMNNSVNKNNVSFVFMNEYNVDNQNMIVYKAVNIDKGMRRCYEYREGSVISYLEDLPDEYITICDIYSEYINQYIDERIFFSVCDGELLYIDEITDSNDKSVRKIIGINIDTKQKKEYNLAIRGDGLAYMPFRINGIYYYLHKFSDVSVIRIDTEDICEVGDVQYINNNYIYSCLNLEEGDRMYRTDLSIMKKYALINIVPGLELDFFDFVDIDPYKDIVKRKQELYATK